MSKLATFLIVAETALVLWATYVFYRWQAVASQPTTPFSDLIPYWGNFESVVAPWIGAALFIPVCALVLAAARRLSRQINSR